MFETAVHPKHGHVSALLGGAIAFATLVAGWYRIVS